MGVVRRKTRVLSAVVAMAALLTQGCGYVLTPSLVAVCDPVVDDRLLGVWTSVASPDEPFVGEGGANKLRIARSGEGYTVEYVRAGKPPITTRVQLFQVNDCTLAELRLAQDASSEGEEEAYTLAAVAIQRGVLGVRLISADWADDHLIANRHAFTCAVRSSPTELHDSLEKAGLDAFVSPSTLFAKHPRKS